MEKATQSPKGAHSTCSQRNQDPQRILFVFAWASASSFSSQVPKTPQIHPQDSPACAFQHRRPIASDNFCPKPCGVFSLPASLAPLSFSLSKPTDVMCLTGALTGKDEDNTQMGIRLL